MGHDKSDIVRITSAARPRSADIQGRQRRYLISMGIRTACVVGCVASIGYWFTWLFAVGAIFLPYIAVVAANGGAAPDPAPDFAYDPDLPALEQGPAGSAADR